jgi:hypothetical protein
MDRHGTHGPYLRLQQKEVSLLLPLLRPRATRPFPKCIDVCMIKASLTAIEPPAAPHTAVCVFDRWAIFGSSSAGATVFVIICTVMYQAMATVKCEFSLLQ